MSDSIDKYIGNTMLNPMPKTAEITHNEWLLGEHPTSDIDTTSSQINVTFPYWKKRLKDDADTLTRAYKFPSRSALIHHLIEEKMTQYKNIQSNA